MNAAEQWREDWSERRPTPSQRLHEVTMAALTRPHAEPESAVELSRNAKGDVQMTVTVRGTDANEAYRKAVELFDALAQRYPRGNGS